MFCRIKSNGKHDYLQIVKSKREGKKVRQQVIANLGRLDKLRESDSLDRLVESVSRFSENLMVLAAETRARKQKNGNKKVETRSIGLSMVCERLWRQTGCRDVLRDMLSQRRFDFDAERAVFMSVAHRLEVSGSDRSTRRWLDRRKIEGTENLSLHHVYRAIAWLGQQLPEDEQDDFSLVPRCVKDVIEEKLFARRRDLFSGLEIVFVDTTSLYFTGQGGRELGKRGKSKDHRPDCVQMVLALVVDKDGVPVCSHMWPGNTADVKTLVPVAKRLESRFGITDICVVADRGMISKKNLEEMEKMGWRYIVGARHRSSKEIRERVMTNQTPFFAVSMERAGKKDPLVLGVKDVWVSDEKEKEGAEPETRRYVVCHNQAQAVRDSETRKALVSDLEEKLKSDPKSLVSNRGYRRYTRVRGQAMEINLDKIEDEKQFDGIWILRTNDFTSAAGDIASRYKQLWRVEQLFRTTKSLLDTRPIFHRTDEAVRGHVFCSFLALVLRRELLECMEENNIKAEWADVVDDLASLEDVSVEAEGKRFIVRSAARGVTGAVMKCLGIRLPAAIRREN